MNLYLISLEALALIGVPAIIIICVHLILKDVQQEKLDQGRALETSKRALDQRMEALTQELRREFERSFAVDLPIAPRKRQLVRMDEEFGGWIREPTAELKRLRRWEGRSQTTARWTSAAGKRPTREWRQ